MPSEKPYNEGNANFAPTIRRLYDAFSNSRESINADLFAPEFSWQTADDNPASVRSGAGLESFLSGMFWTKSEWEQVSFRVDQLLAGDRISVQGYYSAIYRPTGKLLTAQMLHIWTVSHGQILAFQELTDTQEFHLVMNGVAA